MPVLNLDPRAVRVSFPSEDHFQVDLADGRSILVPIKWSERLRTATPEQRGACEILAGGVYLRWDSLDEDIEVVSLLAKDRLLVWPQVL